MLSKPPAGAATGALPPDTTVDPAVDRMGGQARRWPILAMAGTGAALLTWYGYGQLRSPIPFGFFSRPPLYGIFEPTIDPLALLVVPAALLLAAVAWAVTSSMRVRTGLALALIVAAGLIVAMAGELVRATGTRWCAASIPRGPHRITPPTCISLTSTGYVASPNANRN